MSAGTVFIPLQTPFTDLFQFEILLGAVPARLWQNKTPLSLFASAHPSLSTFLHAQIHHFEQWNPFPSASLRKIARQPNESDGENAAIGALPPRKQ
jgi:hypothetical protein